MSHSLVRAPLVVVGLLALSLTAAQARPRHHREGEGVVLRAADLSGADFERLTDPVALDREVLRDALTGLQSDLKVLGGMLRLVHDPRERKALAEQLTGMQARVITLEDAMKRAARLRPGPEAEEKRIVVVTEAPPPQPLPPRPATPAEFARLQQSLRDATFREDHLRVIRSAAKAHSFTTAQVSELVKPLSFGEDQVEALATLHPRVIDPENFHTLYALLAHASDRQALEQRLGE